MAAHLLRCKSANNLLTTQSELFGRALLQDASPVIVQRRHKGGTAQVPAKRKQQKLSKKQESKKDKFHRPTMDNPPPMFSAMSTGNLTHPLFQSGQRQPLNVAPFVAKNIHEGAVGTMAGFSPDKTRPYKVFGLPRRMLLEFRLMSTPSSVVRDITVTVTQALEEAAGRSSSATRVVLTGRQGCGKSFLLLQSVEYCKSQDWIVMYIPRASELVNSSTSFSYDMRTRTYLQPYASKQILQRLLTANESAMSTLKTTRQHDLTMGTAGKDDVVIQKGEPLSKLIEAGTRDFMRYGPTVLELVMEELSAQEDFPVLMAVDEFQSLYCKTQYKDPNFAGISSYHLAVPRLLMEYACGKRSFKRGALFSATSSSPNYLVPLELEEALNMTNRLPPSPYYKRSKTLSDYAQGLLNVEVPAQLSVDEAAAVYGFWKDDRAVIPSAHDENFLAKYSAASGNARDLVWKGVLASLES